MPARSIPIETRLNSRIRRTDNCWEWTGYKDRDGYGTIWYGSSSKGAHRVSYLVFKGPIPEGLVIDHLCRNRGCVNPEHMDIVTNTENVRRGDSGIHERTRKRCPSGHRYSVANTLITKEGHRKCRACARLRSRIARAANPALAREVGARGGEASKRGPNKEK